MADTRGTSGDGSKPEAAIARAARRSEIENLMDEISSQSFPASDPPAWGVAASRLEDLRHGSRGSEGQSSSP